MDEVCSYRARRCLGMGQTGKQHRQPVFLLVVPLNNNSKQQLLSHLIMGVPGLWDVSYIFYRLAHTTAFASRSGPVVPPVTCQRGLPRQPQRPASLHHWHRCLVRALAERFASSAEPTSCSIWIFHAQQTHAGSNPFLRTLFFKIAQLLQHPVLPVFVFGEQLNLGTTADLKDGPNKPVLKRGRNIRGRFGVNDAYSKRFKELLDACGLEWWNVGTGEKATTDSRLRAKQRPNLLS